ncbi:hypothetical protein LTR94_031356, partial [Friedmanniomyces endolithicus]
MAQIRNHTQRLAAAALLSGTALALCATPALAQSEPGAAGPAGAQVDTAGPTAGLAAGDDIVVTGIRA